MSDQRRARILAQLHEGAATLTAVTLGQVCRRITGVTGAGIMLMAGDLPLGSVCSTDDVSALIEDLQYTLGEGPCVDAYALNRPVLEPDLADPAVARWPGFSGPALEAGVRAVFGFPMGIGATRMGALNLYSVRPGTLSDDQQADSLVMADIAAEVVLAIQGAASAGVVSPELEAGSNFRYVVHQAAGMVSGQLNVSVAQALVCLRAHAFAHQLPLDDVAADVVARRLRFTEEAI